MNEPWKIKESDIRKADLIPTFIVFCEDKVSEPVYLKYFETSKIKINFAKEQKSMMTNVLSAITHCKENGLIKYSDGNYYLAVEETQIWCVYDRDKEETSEKTATGNTNFDESIKTATSNGIKVAWSNDAFELWVLLHFEDVSVKNDNSKNRKFYYDRLTEIFMNQKNPNDDLVKVLKYKNYSYKENLKSENNFRNIVRNVIVGKTNDAIQRAETLENNFSKKSIQNHDKSPCTLIHHLVLELIRLGEKKI